MSVVRFVHAADLHLDSPFSGIRAVNPHVGEALREATFVAFERIIGHCIAERVDALLIAGDIYDASDRSLRAQLRFIQGIERLDRAGIQSFVCHGNHDPLDGWTARLRLPASCHQFGTSIEAAPIQGLAGVEVIGASYPRAAVMDDLASGYDRSPSSGFSIGMLHCNVGGVSGHDNYAPTAIETLINSGIDYWALGHVHTRQILRRRNPAIIYPGNPQGLSPRETGPRGVYLVEVNEHHGVTTRFEELDAIRWSSLQVDIRDLTSEQLLLDALTAKVETLLDESGGRPVIYRISFEGNGPLHERLGNPRFVADIVASLNDAHGERPAFAWCDQAATRTSPLFDRESRREAGDFLATVLRLTDTLQANPDERGVLRDDLAVLLQDERFAPYAREAGITEEALSAIITESERRIAGMLGMPA